MKPKCWMYYVMSHHIRLKHDLFSLSAKYIKSVCHIMHHFARVSKKKTNKTIKA